MLEALQAFILVAAAFVACVFAAFAALLAIIFLCWLPCGIAVGCCNLVCATLDRLNRRPI